MRTEDLNDRDSVLRAVGFTPPALAKILDENKALKLPEAVKARRAHLIEFLGLTWRINDKHATRGAMEQVRAFNEGQPSGARINFDAVMDAMKDQQQ
jgi:hypothetical protein